MNQNKSSIVGRIGRTAARHPIIVIVSWMVLAAIAIGIGANTDAYHTDYSFTVDTESQNVQKLEEDAFGQDEMTQEMLVIQSQQYVVSDPEFQKVVDDTIANLAPMQDEILNVTRYYDAPDAPEMQALVSADQHTLLVLISFAQPWSAYQDEWPTWESILVNSETDGFYVGSIGAIGSSEISQIIADDMAKEISIGLPAALIVMIVVFGALVAAGLPLILGVVTIGVATGIVQIIAGNIYISDIAFTMVSMIGLAVGIDYSLFLLERFREERRAGLEKLDAIERACGTAGKAVLFSGLTTVLALFGVFFVPLGEFQGMGVAMAIAVAVAVAGALTSLPALITLIGDKVNWPRMRQQRTHDGSRLGAWGKIAERVVEYPVVSAVVVTALLLLATAPVLTMNLGNPALSSLPESRYVKSFEIVAEEFSAGIEEPVIIAVQGDLAKNGGVDDVQNYLASTGKFGPSSVRSAETGDTVFVTAPLIVDNNSQEGQDTIGNLRRDLLPEAGDDVQIGGAPAGSYDFNHLLESSLPVVFGFVLTFSFLVMMIAFRSITVPIISVVLNMLSVGAAYGLVVLVFQHGFMADVFGFKTGESIVNWLPIILFCILFGLSMDYHVFVLSRIREAWDRTHSVDRSIVDGIDHTGRIITGAAVIMMAVFGSFALGRMAEMQQMGFGLAAAVLIDVTLIRSILLPASLKLIGDRAWWWPRALGWMPRVNVEG